MILRLLDTNICIYLIRGKLPDVVAHLQRQPADSIGISVITLAELRLGVSRSRDPGRNRVALAHFLAPIQVMPFDVHAAEAYGEVRAALERVGTPIGPLDTLIAAHAISLNVAVVTDNEREFRRVSGLEVENWVTK